MKGEGKKGIMLGIENGYGMGKDLSGVGDLGKGGVVYMRVWENGKKEMWGCGG